MTGLRRTNRLARTLVVLTVTLAVGLGIGGTASAAFTKTLTVPPVYVSTATVAAPGNVTARMVSCSSARSQDILLTWGASATARTSGYRVTVYRSNGTVITTSQTPATTTAVTVTVNKFSYDPAALQFSVTTLTDYGWSTESPKTGAVPC
ncbi:hypothetical protein SAMN05661080_03757 [Modestobacter sp. DSM 44400]|uniref:hypothetical protein n=1 Tax=Modestobacter sp. DSM 44400 TaxID=1550230 RepID=UPI000898987A|nr:hypothetical protein [Modestobacter sp. DSM 44400]SDY52800.1 hypothetical protein SAMN05661080_03757 [Modestobacter sp. DSM 44400]